MASENERGVLARGNLNLFFLHAKHAQATGKLRFLVKMLWSYNQHLINGLAIRAGSFYSVSSFGRLAPEGD